MDEKMIINEKIIMISKWHGLLWYSSGWAEENYEQ
jgi:hypothetical protein